MQANPDPVMPRTLSELRSRRWFDATDMRGFAHRQRIQQMGMRREDVLDRPCVAIINTWSDLSPCHAHLRERAESIKRGVLMAGGMPFELPALSLGEVMVKPTTMLYRNLSGHGGRRAAAFPAHRWCGAARPAVTSPRPAC